jgi:hypothetical protein
MDIKVTILMLIVAGIQVVRELLGLYRDARDTEDADDS